MNMSEDLTVLTTGTAVSLSLVGCSGAVVYWLPGLNILITNKINTMLQQKIIRI